MNSKIITISGELGSGKSTVSKLLASKINISRYSTGEIQRQIASYRSISTLELNVLAETDQTIDQEIDSIFSKLSVSDGGAVIDSRMAWHFMPDSVKIKLLVAPEEAANRVFADKTRSAEPNKTLDEAYTKLQKRRQSEASRFQKLYSVDCENENNFDFVIDTGNSDPDKIVTLIQKLIAGDIAQQKYWASPKNLFPTEDIRLLAREDARLEREQIASKGYDFSCTVDVTRWDHDYFIQRGHKNTSAAILNSVPLIPLQFVDTGFDINLSRYYDWEDAHDFRFSRYPKNEPKRQNIANKLRIDEMEP